MLEYNVGNYSQFTTVAILYLCPALEEHPLYYTARVRCSETFAFVRSRYQGLMHSTVPNP